MSVSGIRKEAILTLKSLILMHRDVMIIEKSKQEKDDKSIPADKSGNKKSEDENKEADKEEKEVKVYSWQKAQEILTSEKYGF